MVTYNICFDIVALVLLLVIVLLYFIKRGIPSYQNHLFFLLILCALVACVFDIADVVFINAGNRIPNWLKYISSSGCFVLQVLEALLVFYYVVGITNTWKEIKLRVKAATIIPYIIMLILTVTNYYTRIIFYFDEQGNYVRGSARDITILLGVFYLILAAGRIRLLKSSITKGNRIILWIITIITIAGVAAQTFVAGLITQMFGITLCLLIAFFTLQNPFLTIDSYLKVYNRSSFVTMTSLDFAAGKKFSVIAVMIDDISFMQRNFGIERVRALMREVAARFRELEEDVLIYHINDACFCLVISGIYRDSIDGIMDEIARKFERPWKLNDILTVLSVHQCRIDCPEDVGKLEDVFDVISYVSEESMGAKIVYAHDLDVEGRNVQKLREQVIRDAIEYSLFDVCYREIYSVETGQPVGVEITLSVTGDDGVFYTDDCKELLEKTGQNFRVGIYLFRSACDYLVRSRAVGKKIDSVEIGISIFLCMQPEYLREILWIMKEYKINPGTIRLKITESEAVDSSKQLQEMMKKFSEAGVWFTLDGYGTGYSNISYIYELPFAYVQMDRAVFQAAIGDEQAMRILKNTINMLHELDMQVVISQTELDRHTELLREIQCDYTIGSYRQL